MTEILLAIKGASELIRLGSEILEIANKENRTPTAEELKRIRDKRAEVDQRWADAAPAED